MKPAQTKESSLYYKLLKQKIVKKSPKKVALEFNRQGYFSMTSSDPENSNDASSILFIDV